MLFCLSTGADAFIFTETSISLSAVVFLFNSASISQFLSTDISQSADTSVFLSTSTGSFLSVSIFLFASRFSLVSTSISPSIGNTFAPLFLSIISYILWSVFVVLRLIFLLSIFFLLPLLL